MSRAKVNRATKAAGLDWNEPKKEDATTCRYKSVEGASLTVLQYPELDQAAAFEDRSECKTTPVELSATAYVCNFGKKGSYAALGYTVRDGRLWGLLTLINEKRGLESTAEQFFLARVLAEIEGFDKKAILKVLE